MTRYGVRRMTQATWLGMEQKQHEWMQAVTEALSDLLAARVAQATLLEAMLVSHPDPGMLRKAWDELSSQRIAYVAQKKALADDPRSMDAYTLEQFQAWEEKLNRYFPRDVDTP
ncbi:hypothetical protein JH271_06740 [Xanthomonas campestris pv. campestris]|uniref:hypothetical protein n=1 Tax=Xanthomonas campestris TaxID=339 RepID=UPI0023678194|nr:hypothetical protein [Xanthomonas campestris]MDM7584061.1 hypothetical protein [Xanthomonas campestris]MDM7591182.1 hypothetical protein [Xanthomonas campestris]MEA0759458.1 hypothetical protein [Xanthomonas campestris pv. campestris]MEA9863116.1 hypothetical protein [Xanthomonas campestris pv. raphani]MEB1221704.1 hypothetical protein [Xanthomonas campestris pv. campestris]